MCHHLKLRLPQWPRQGNYKGYYSFGSSAKTRKVLFKKPHKRMHACLDHPWWSKVDTQTTNVLHLCQEQESPHGLFQATFSGPPTEPNQPDSERDCLLITLWKRVPTWWRYHWQYLVNIQAFRLMHLCLILK